MEALMRESGIPKEDGNVARLFEAAQNGDFLKARILAVNGKGPLLIHYNWLYSALACAPGGPSDFYWVFSKTEAGRLTLSPSAPPLGRRLYVSVRDDSDWFLQVQAPHSADWITSAGRDELLGIEGTGILSFVLSGFNSKYVATNQAETKHDNISGYRLQAVNSVAVGDCEFQIANPTILQPGLTFLTEYTPDLNDIAVIAAAYNVPLDEDAARELLQTLPKFTPELLAQQTSADLQAEGFGMFAGALIGGILGGVVGFAMGGGIGAAAGIAIGLKFGSGIGLLLEPSPPSPDPPPVVNPKIPSVAKTLFDISPVGGPYQNKHYWHDLIDFSKSPQIGSDKLPYACCLYPPAALGSVQLWSPTQSKVIPFIIDESRWPPIKASDGIELYMAIFVIVKTQDKYQFRLHPDEALINGPNRPNHSQLILCGRLCGLAGGEMDQVYAAGEIYCYANRRVRGITSRTGHFWDKSGSFDANVTETARRALTALGYNTNDVLLGQKFWDWVSGRAA
jgi:hypothetical protein